MKIEWKGGECPVPGDTKVRVWLRDGSIYDRHTAEEYTWSLTPADDGPHQRDIVAYEVPEPAKARLPSDAAARKNVPIATGFIDYFPDAIIAVAELSHKGNDQHNPGKPLFWDRSKSGDEWDALMRHFVERGTTDTDGVRHSAKVAWRALAGLQKEIEKERTK